MMKKRIVEASKRKKPSTLIKRGKYHHFLSHSRGVVDIEKNRIYKMARLSGMLGESIEQLAKRVGVPRRVLGNWMIKDPKITLAMEKGMDAMLVQVELAALKRAKGYDVPRVEKSVEKDANGRIVKKTTKRSKLHVPADPTTLKFILSKRSQKRYPADQIPEGTKIIINMDEGDGML